MGLFPKILGSFQRIDFESFPPRNLIASLMKLPMMPAAKRNREFIADLKAHGSRLSKLQMMRIARLSPADRVVFSFLSVVRLCASIIVPH
jgi:hypothetical protein